MDEQINLGALPFFIPLKTGRIIAKSGVLFSEENQAAAMLAAYDSLLSAGPNGLYPPWSSYAETKLRRDELAAAMNAVGWTRQPQR